MTTCARCGSRGYVLSPIRRCYVCRPLNSYRPKTLAVTAYALITPDAVYFVGAVSDDQALAALRTQLWMWGRDEPPDATSLCLTI